MKRSKHIILAAIMTTIVLTSMIAIANSWLGYIKPAFTDYVPSGMPDFDQKVPTYGQGAPQGVYTWCGPVATANSLWWLDSEYESIMFPAPVPPPTISDHFSLVTSYNPQWDDHHPQNVPFLVQNLAFLMDTDGIRTGDGHKGTRWQDMQAGINQYLLQQGVASLFEVHSEQFANFTWIENEVEICQDVELFLEFWQESPPGSWQPLTGNPSLENGHFVTCAGVNSTASELLISDPYQDAFEAGAAPGRSPVVHPPGHGPVQHDNTTYVSQDAYFVATRPIPNPYMQFVGELVGYLQTLGYLPNFHAFIRAAVSTSPKEIPEWLGYVKPAFKDYAPSGIPDFDQKQDNWGPQGTYTWCGPVATANSLWWLDSEYESIMFPAPVPPPTISDHFPLVTSYNQLWDDHDPQNVDPLVRNLAFLMDTDDLAPPYDGHIGTRWQDMQAGINQYLIQQGVASLFEVHSEQFANFTWIENEVEICQDVELFLEFWQWDPQLGWERLYQDPSLENGHFVTCAGVNSTASELLISDPYQDAFEAGAAPGRSPVFHPYPHGSTVHNDTQYVSQDAYQVAPWMLPPPPGYPPMPTPLWELVGYLQTLGPQYDPTWHTFIRAAVATSPTGVHDVATKNLTSAKTVIGRGYGGNVTATAQNHGDFAENFNVTTYANTTKTTAVNFVLTNGTTQAKTFVWNTTGFAYGNYTLVGAADVVPGEIDVADNNYTCVVPVHVGVPGDVSSSTPGVYDKKCDMKDIAYLVILFNTKPTSPNWNPNADVDNNGVVNMIDIAIAILNFNKHE